MQFLRLPQVREKVGLSRSQIYRMIADGTFPPPVKLGPQISVWPEHEIKSWQRRVLTTEGRAVSE